MPGLNSSDPVLSNRDIKDSLIIMEELVTSEYSLDVIRDRVKDLAFVADKIERGNIFAKEAFLITTDKIYEMALDFLINEARRAIVATNEFNFDGWPAHLEAAIRFQANEGSIFKFEFDETAQNGRGSLTSVSIDLSGLGSVIRYAEIVMDARGYEPASKYKGLPEKLGTPAPNGMEDLASYFWMEKYYKPAREGA
jgi:hypothetical protein